MKIVVLGPVAPFRGGIARHTSRLAQQFASNPDHEVSICSFSKLYPKILYPGQNDRDPDASPPHFASTHYGLNSANPFSWHQLNQRIQSQNPCIVVMPAWTFFVSPALGWIAKRLRRNGIKVVQIVHNASDHETSIWKTALSMGQLKHADGYIVHNRQVAKELQTLLPDAKITISAHPLYDDYPEPTAPTQAKAGLELLFFGLVRRYKGLDVALRALADSGIKSARFTIAGEFWEGLDETRKLIAELGIQDRVELHPNYVNDQQAADFFDRADAVILPYLSASGSGVVAMAQNYKVPVAASDIPSFQEAVLDGETGWLFPVGDFQKLAELINGRISRASALQMQPALDKQKALLGWDHYCEDVLIAAGLQA
jgi:glycosyltransferase involved in cell wall biosynthesis